MADIFLIFLLLATAHSFGPQSQFLKDPSESCFCKLDGEVDDCSCTIESVDSFNNNNVYPVLNSLMERNYFKFYPVDLQQPCKYWPSGGKCALKDCSVKPCSEEDVPIGLKSSHLGADKYSKQAQQTSSCNDEDSLGKIDQTISDDSHEAFKSWSKHDDAETKFCELDDELSPTIQYVNLLLNPEAYTGYSGEDAHKIWNSIYEENCFLDRPIDESPPKPLSYTGSNQGTCLEKRVFYRMVSGLHTSINTHLSARYIFPDKETAFGQVKASTFEVNAEEFTSRFDPQTTNGKGPFWLKNLYFAYLVELRALAKVTPYLQKQEYFTGIKSEDRETHQVISSLLDTISAFPHHFDESQLFQGDSLHLKEEFRLKFLNISTIMDCVGCEKCKLWGKVQIRGMGTALKILFSGGSMAGDSTITKGQESQSGGFQLNRMEIVSLFNAFSRLSTSIKYIEDFRRLST